MDRKAYIVLIVSFLLLMVWVPLTNRLFPPTPLPPGATNRIESGLTSGTNLAATNAPANTNSMAASGSQGSPPPTPIPSTPGAPEEFATLENDDVIYTFSSLGGGIDKVELKGIEATVECGRDRIHSTNRATLNSPAPFPALTVVSSAGWDNAGTFSFEKGNGGLRAVKNLDNGLRWVKDYHLSTNYLVKAVIRLENHSGETVTLPPQEWIVGTASAMGTDSESLAMGFEWYSGAKAERVNEAWFANKVLGCFPGQPRSEYSAGASNVVWAAVHNQFFTMVAIPQEPAAQIVGRRINLRASDFAPGAAVGTDRSPFAYQASLVYSGVELPPGQALERRFDLYAGPKKYHTLSLLEKNVDLVMGFDGFFGFFSKALLLSMNGLHGVGLSYGLAIVVITVVIKLLFWPLTTASTRSMKRMAALQPQMKAIQEKYKDDPKKMNTKLMEFMRENKVSPLGGCLPVLLQIPVFIGFYKMLQSAIELRGEEFLWVCDLSRPDTIFVIPGLEFPVNAMPLLMGVTMLCQARMTPASPGMDPMQQKIMKYMPLMFMVFLYNFSAGLTLYWTVQNLLSIAQMKLTRTDPAAPAAASSPASTGPKPPAKKKR